MRGKA